ncbi:coiled-coil domain-containing protein 115 [Bradysia coprophila]|uniref:coiled-coil domain-containing protein 115 n=1 Tax=Bradysia coprophila TaxID=38358 RepID=UPI00187DBC07|nr:coiled-coil domain-containing protein 115 [Bradysia coprophila]
MDTIDRNELVDKLTIEMLDLIEQQVKCKMNISNLIAQGQIQIAKTRYTQGTRTVSTSQLPTENSQEFKALRTVDRVNNDVGDVQLNLNVETVNKDDGYVDPIKWFGILVPQSLQLARDAFQKSIEYSCESANIQSSLWRTMSNILLLKKQISLD